jgi:hypothetical protein
MKMLRRLWWITIGAALAWFFDPDHGEARRAQAREKLEGTFGGSGSGNTDASTSRPYGSGTGSKPMTNADASRDPLRDAAAR